MENKELQNEEISILSLTDEEGNEAEFELVDSVEYKGSEYLILLPLDEENAAEVIILEVEAHADGTENYLTVEDEETLTAVFTIFKERFADFFTFEE